MCSIQFCKFPLVKIMSNPIYIMHIPNIKKFSSQNFVQRRVMHKFIPDHGPVLYTTFLYSIINLVSEHMSQNKYFKVFHQYSHTYRYCTFYVLFEELNTGNRYYRSSLYYNRKRENLLKFQNYQFSRLLYLPHQFA